MPNTFSPGTRCRVMKAYEAEFPAPLALREGDAVNVEDRKTTFVGWLWCTNANGESRWVPTAFLDRDANERLARMNRNYDSRELSVKVGEMLTVEERESEWLLCSRESSGECGWVPESCVEMLT